MQINFKIPSLTWNFLHRSYSLQKRLSMNLTQSIYKYFWVDMEMTGLNVEKDKILEVACYLTDTELNHILEGPNLVIHQPDNVLNSMDEWCIIQHNKTGLVEESKKSKIREADAERLLLDFLSKHVSYKTAIISGNTVYMDKMFLAKHLSKVNDYLHYRIIDVSTVKELCRNWYPKTFQNVPKKMGDHRAKSDILASIEELRFYREKVFK